MFSCYIISLIYSLVLSYICSISTLCLFLARLRSHFPSFLLKIPLSIFCRVLFQLHILHGKNNDFHASLRKCNSFHLLSSFSLFTFFANISYGNYQPLSPGAVHAFVMFSESWAFIFSALRVKVKNFCVHQNWHFTVRFAHSFQLPRFVYFFFVILKR